MKPALIIASLLLAFPLAGCEDRDAYWQRQQQEGMAKWWENHDREVAQSHAEWEAESTRSAIEQNTQALQELESKLH